MIWARRTAQALESTHGAPVGPASAFSFLAEVSTLGHTPSRSAMDSGGWSGIQLDEWQTAQRKRRRRIARKAIERRALQQSSLEASFHSTGHRNGISSGI